MNEEEHEEESPAGTASGKDAGWLKTPWSLRRNLVGEEKEWRRFNKYRTAFAQSHFARDLLFAGEHPFRFTVSLLVLVAAALVLLHLLPSGWIRVIWVPAADDRLTHFSTLWAVQATLVAVVYPIVIAFVTVFLQRRPASEVFIHLYVLHSGALAAGLSSLALVVVMAAQYALLPIYGVDALPQLVALDAVWFLLNAILTTCFLFRSVEFLRPEVQADVIRRYAVSVALPRDVMRLYSFQMLAQAQTRGWIPALEYGDDEDEDGPKVLMSRVSFSSGETQGTLRLREPSRLIDVRLWPLRLVVMSWTRAARRHAPPEDPLHLRHGNSPLLNIAMAPGTEYHDGAPMARVSAGPALAQWQRWLLRQAFVFEPTRRERYGIAVSVLLRELEADARTAAAKADIEGFKTAYEALVSAHELLLGASLTPASDGTITSWALLPNIVTFFDEPLYREWTNSYRSIFDAAIQAVLIHAEPVYRLCHVVQHLEGENLQSSPIEVRENVLQLPPLLMFRLSGWWVRQVEEQGSMEHGHHKMVLLRPPFHRIYEDVLIRFVGGWESARSAIADVPEGLALEWRSVPDVARLNRRHIEETARMLLAAVVRGDRAAAEWLTDVLVKWCTFHHEHAPFPLYGKTAYLTLEHLRLDWHELAGRIGLAEHGTFGDGTPAELQRGVVLAAIENYWTDIRLLVLELLISWAATDQSPTLDDSLAVEIAVGLLTGKRWRTGGELTAPLSELSAHKYVAAKVRQHAAGGEWRDGYVGALSQFVERVKESERPDMVTSRVYSFSGADDVASLQESMLLLLALLSADDWVVGEGLQRQVDVWMATQYRSVDILRSRLSNWLQRLENPEELPHKVLSALLNRTGRTHDGLLGRERSKRGLESLRDFIESRREDVLAAEPVDADRLRQIAQFASAKAFSSTSGNFPLQLFSEVQGVTTSLMDFTLRTQNVRKGELTRIEMDQRAANEREYWGETMAGQVAVVVLGDLLRLCNIRDVLASDAAAYWNVLKAEAVSICQQGGIPVLLLDNATRPEWVWQWQHADHRAEYLRPEDLRVQRREGKGSRYVCNFNDIEVYVAPIPAGQSILLSSTTFFRASFQRFEGGQFVQASVSPRDDSRHLVDLELKFSRQVEVRDAEAVRLRYVDRNRREPEAM